MNLTLKKKYYNPIKPTNFSDMDKEVLKKAIAAMELQETKYYVEESNSYQLVWQDILLGILTKEEATSGLGYFICHYGYNMWNDLSDLFDEVFNMPKPPNQLFDFNRAHRETQEYKDFVKVYHKEKLRIIQKYINDWNQNESTVVEKTLVTA
ncbi:hypothetical protein [Bacillus cereus group sp. TH152-1LC]|uniref:hypothetical protein n=1 Tax=Bacillus cereus group sp. TH152-1LC TaxID=3018060 RepID=UPI0022DEE91E|nr:hypothetical protein [Bacillus cereus group sp. TH152-1LC]MDA1674984.1 hypothetical protein [Bacillus cereus group sp. TH152-1LC]